MPSAALQQDTVEDQGRRYLNTNQLAELLDLAIVTLELWRRQGRGPAHLRVGRRVLYDRRDIDRWLAANRRGGDGAASAAAGCRR